MTDGLATTLRVLGPDDGAGLERYLRLHADTAMFMRSNIRAAGLIDHGEAYQGTYAATFSADRITGVVCHAWNGMVLTQAAEGLAELVRAAVGRSGREVNGIVGPLDQVTQARQFPGLQDAPTSKDSAEELLALDLAALILPEPLRDQTVTCRLADRAEIGLLSGWRVAYAREALLAAPGPRLRAESREEIERLLAERRLWVLVSGDTPVACSSFNAVLPDMVQIGGVWTPPGFRNRGYARAVVSGSLAAVRQAGVRRAILFTDSGNGAAQRAYRSIGFQRVGDYAIVIFQAGLRPS